MLLWSFLVAFIETVRARLARGPARPSWPLAFETIVRHLRRDWERTAAWDLPRLRRDLDGRPFPKGVLKKLAIRDEVLSGVAARWFVPETKTERGDHAGRIVLYFHGGSYIYGSARSTHADVIARLALESGLTVVGVDYRLAPEHPFPAALDDGLAAYDALRADGFGEVVLAGDSAGGNLALELQLRLRECGDQATRLLLVSPWADLEMPGRSFVENDDFDYGTRDVLLVHARAYANGIDLADPRLSPVNADLGGLAPVMIISGEVEIPRDDQLRLATLLEAAGVEVTRYIADDMPHNPPVFAAYHANGQAALRAAAAFVRGS